MCYITLNLLLYNWNLHCRNFYIKCVLPGVIFHLKSLCKSTHKSCQSRREQQVLSTVTHWHYISTKPRPSCLIYQVPLPVEHLLVNCPLFEETRLNQNLSTSIFNIFRKWRDQTTSIPKRGQSVLQHLKISLDLKIIFDIISHNCII